MKLMFRESLLIVNGEHDLPVHNRYRIRRNGAATLYGRSISNNRMRVVCFSTFIII